MRLNDEEIIAELKLRILNEKSLRKKYLLKEAINAFNELSKL